MILHLKTADDFAIRGNEFAWVGATCVASWGYSSTCFNGNCTNKLPWKEGPDARDGEQPRGTRVLNNLFREMGIYQKQASAYFHAKSGLTEIAGNVVFNGPRAMFNFNDGMLGGDNVSQNDGFCIQNEKLCIKNEECCIKNEELCIEK